MSRNLKQITPRYKKMCECETCINCKQLKRTLNFWGRRHVANKNRYKYVVFSDDNVLNETTRNTVNIMIFPKQFGTNLSN